MLVLKNNILELSMKEDGTHVVLEDLERGVRWRLDASTRFVSKDVPRFEHGPYQESEICSDDAKVMLAGKGKAEKRGENIIHTSFSTAAGEVNLRWEVEKDRLRVFAEADSENAADAVSLPGTFRPEGDGFLSAVPTHQGVLHTGKGPAFYEPLSRRGHRGGRNLEMFGQISSKGSLVIAAETEADASIHWEKTNNGRVNLMWVQHPSMGKLSYEREIVIMSADPDLTSVCKRYRKYVIEKGRFKSWEEKIAERPVLKSLFGSVITFLGYHQDPDLDYADSFRRLKKMGFDKIYAYPIFMGSTIDLEQGPAKPADTRNVLPVLAELGYTAGSFIYIVDGPKGEGDDPHRDLLFGPDGKPQKNWAIKDLVWYKYAREKRFEVARKMLDEEHEGLNGMHYDVLCNDPYQEDYHPDHTTDARFDREVMVKMLEYAGNKNMIVSSEGFNDRMTPYYDLGNAKLPFALGGEEYCVVPMTMLVYHDSAYHTWWEVDNYNNPQHRSQGNRGYRYDYPRGGGWYKTQSAMDALMGTPPDIFPFGLQYNFVPYNRPDVYLYRFRLEDKEVKEALPYAKRVAELNARIGKLEMIGHRLHRPDGAIQETVFSDGTRVVANFANVALEASGIGLLQPESWKVID